MKASDNFLKPKHTLKYTIL